MKFSDEQLKEKTLARDYRAVARLITRIENDHPGARSLAASMRRPSGRAHVIGITGAPGAGKSTLVDHIAMRYRSDGASVAILAVDPSSPFSGGAILGDRIRMNRAADDSSIFIRSMATRGSLGGLAKATLESIHVLDCAGFDVILLETVGVGQAEVDVVRSADTCVVVLVPGMGDSVQIIKAGLMEIADVFVINKADRDGALTLEKDLLTLLSLVETSPDDWRPKVVKTVATECRGIDEVVAASKSHVTWLESSSKGYARRLKVLSQTITQMATDWIARRALAGKEQLVEALAKECVERRKTPLEAVEELVRSKVVMATKE
jgi:LAO/AO transport system kinase